MANLRERSQCGALYIATGSKCIDEAVQSVRSLKASNPTMQATLVTDLSGPFSDFDEIITIENPTHSSYDKVANIHRSPYEKTLFLDSDTYIVDKIDDVFTLLDRFDFAGMIEVARGYWYRRFTDLPDSFPEINSGVLAFRKCPAVARLFITWERCYKESVAWQKTPGLTNRVWDQPSLRQALYTSADVRISSLPSEYNALQYTGTFLWGKAKILHGRNRLEHFEASINRHPNTSRVYIQQVGTYSRGGRFMSTTEMLNFALRVNAVLAGNLIHRIRFTLRRLCSFRTRRGHSTPLQEGISAPQK